MDLLPLKATFAPGEELGIEVGGAVQPFELSLWSLDRRVATADVAPAERIVRLPAQPEGGYGVEARADGRLLASTALDVLADPLSRPRYGFVAGFERDRDPAGIAAWTRSLHLNAVQLYDWMYRHARLLPPADDFEDALGRPLSLETVRRVAGALAEAGSLPLAYAAVYAVGTEAWPQWRDAGLFRPSGEPWRLGDDFLLLVDPGDPGWQRHFNGQLREALAGTGAAGFHLDQYGWPKRALRADGTVVDLADAFVSLIGAVRAALPDARLVFNNVNDFPTWATAEAPQDATYIEVWPPHTGLDHLAGLVERARALAPDRPPILAAYLSCFAAAPEPQALAAYRLATATIASRGGAQILAGEEGAVLTDPYYPSHHELGPEGRETLRRWHDFLVRHGDLLYDPGAVPITRSVLGGINEELVVEAPVPVTADARPGTLWAHAVRSRHGLVVHLLNLTGADELAWDGPKQAPQPLDAELSVLRTGGTAPEVLAADPDGAGRLEPVPTTTRDGYDIAELRSLGAWTVALVRDEQR